MKIVALVPFWFNYDKDNSVYMRKLSGEYLINYTLNTLKQVSSINQICVFCSDKQILDYIKINPKIFFVQRDTSLDSLDVSIEQIISSFLDIVEADIVVLLHPNCPFIQAKTIKECIDRVCLEENDSSFTAMKLQKFAWMNGSRLNYSEKNMTPNKNEISPIIVEQGSVYVFSRKTFISLGKRIGINPFIKYINHFEGHEVVEKEDYEIAELIINSGMIGSM
jgi:CMP-N-acetylneuraminic acid synthetase